MTGGTGKDGRKYFDLKTMSENMSIWHFISGVACVLLSALMCIHQILNLNCVFVYSPLLWVEHTEVPFGHGRALWVEETKWWLTRHLEGSIPLRCPSLLAAVHSGETASPERRWGPCWRCMKRLQLGFFFNWNEVRWIYYWVHKSWGNASWEPDS